MAHFWLKSSLLVVGVFLAIVPLRADVLFFDGFESGDRSHTANGFVWSFDSFGEQPGDLIKVTSQKARSGDYSLLFRFGASVDGDSWAEQHFELGRYYNEFWIKFDLFVPTNYYHRGEQAAENNNKSMYQVWEGDHGTGTGLAYGWEMWPNGNGGSRLSFHPDRPELGHLGFVCCFIDISDRGKWVQYIAQVVPATSANNDGIARMWKQVEGQPRVLIFEMVDLAMYNAVANYVERGYILGWANSGFDQDTSLYVDNIAIADSLTGLVRPFPPTLLPVEILP